jgi:hypothetical protein
MPSLGGDGVAGHSALDLPTHRIAASLHSPRRYDGAALYANTGCVCTDRCKRCDRSLRVSTDKSWTQTDRYIPSVQDQHRQRRLPLDRWRRRPVRRQGDRRATAPTHPVCRWGAPRDRPLLLPGYSSVLAHNTARTPNGARNPARSAKVNRAVANFSIASSKIISFRVCGQTEIIWASARRAIRWLGGTIKNVSGGLSSGECGEGGGGDGGGDGGGGGGGGGVGRGGDDGVVVVLWWH